MYTGDWKKLQVANQRAKQSTVGLLSSVVEDLYLNNRIEHYEGFLENYILGAVSSQDEAKSNILFGSYVNTEEVMTKIMFKVHAGKLYFVRVDFMADANYKVGSELVLYQP